MWRALPGIVAALDRDERVRVIVLRGEGTGSFASGADIAEFETVRADAEGGRHYEAINEAAFWAVAHCSKPVIHRPWTNSTVPRTVPRANRGHAAEVGFIIRQVDARFPIRDRAEEVVGRAHTEWCHSCILRSAP